MHIFARNMYKYAEDSPATGNRAVSYTHLRAHETVLDLVCRLLLEKKKHKLLIKITYTNKNKKNKQNINTN